MESALFAIREHLPELSKTERKVADYVLAEPKKVLYYNLSELAEQSGVSQAAIVRFSRRVGMNGFRDFKLRLSHDVYRNGDERYFPNLELESDMAPSLVVKGVVGGVQRNMALLESLSDIHLLNRCVDLIRRARVIYIFGSGASGLVAQDMYQKLVRIGIPCSAPMDTDLQIIAACNLQEKDAAMIISYSGENPAMVTVSQRVRQNGAKVITLTMESENTLRKSADIALLVPSMERIYRTGAMLSRISQLAVIDMVYTLLLSRDLDNAIPANTK